MALKNSNLDRSLPFLVTLALLLGTLVCYWPVGGFDFINLDDPVYVTEQPMVQSGFTQKNIAWAFHSTAGGNWNPLIWFSHMADCEVFGLTPGGHHVTNLLLHMANVCLLFMVLRKMTRAFWRSAFVAAIFAWHPMHVESVAWVAERKDVLSTLFWLLTLWAYFEFTARLKIKRANPRGRYLLALIFFALGLLCKSMLVTLPFTLLLLDYWPLRRDKYRVWKNAVVEKIPFYALTAISCGLAMWAQGEAGAIGLKTPLILRLEQSAIAGAVYVEKFFLPVNMGVFYPFPAFIPMAQFLTALLVLAGISGAVFVTRKTHPYLLVGWGWFLGTLVPVIGLVKIGMQGTADRYTYVPYIGLGIMLGWGLVDLVRNSSYWRSVLAPACAVALACLVAVTIRQVSYWRDSVTLYRHTLGVVPHSFLPHSNLAGLFMLEGRYAEAEAQDRIVVTELPDVGMPYLSLGCVLALENKIDEAAEAFKSAIRFEPGLASAHYNLGNAYLIKGRTAEGIEEIKKAASLKGDELKANEALADIYMRRGKADEALPYAEAFARLDPDNPRAYFVLGQAYLTLHRVPDAVKYTRIAARMAPDSAASLNSLAWIDAACTIPEFRNGPEAVRLAETAVKLTKHRQPAIMDTLAAAYAEVGQFERAIQVCQQMQKVATANNDKGMAELAIKRMALYREGKPVRED